MGMFVLGLAPMAAQADNAVPVVPPVVPAAPAAPTAPTAPAAPAAQLSLTEAGVVIDTGTEKFTLPIPSLIKSAGGSVAGTITMGKDDKSLVEKFTNDVQLTVALESDGKTITYEYTEPPADVRGLGINMDIPIEYANGGKYGLGSGELKDFPAQKGKDEVVDKGDSGMFRLQSPSGTGFGLKMASGWNKLQDDRNFNGSKFEEQYLYLFATYHGQTYFTITVGDLDPKVLAATPVPTPSIPPPPKPVVKKLVDQFGQPLGKDYPGKITSEDELKADIAADKAYYDSLTPPPTDLYGGLPDSGAKYKLKTTGSFHVEKIGERFVLVDPAGNLFFERGLCPIAPLADYTLTGGRTDAFEWLPSTPDEKTEYQVGISKAGMSPSFPFTAPI